MPKERIKHGRHYANVPISDGRGYSTVECGPDGLPYSPVPEGTEYIEDPSLDVTWSRDNGHVQLSIEFTREQWLSNLRTLQEDEAITRRAIFTDSLARHEINHLIRILRRARDAAYGSDE